MKTILISNIDYDRSLALTIQGQCPVVSHGLHSVEKGKTECSNCGISSCELVARRGEPHSASTGFQHKPADHNTYLVRGSRGPLYITAHLETPESAMAQYLEA